MGCPKCTEVARSGLASAGFPNHSRKYWKIPDEYMWHDKGWPQDSDPGDTPLTFIIVLFVTLALIIVSMTMGWCCTKYLVSSYGRPTATSIWRCSWLITAQVIVVVTYSVNNIQMYLIMKKVWAVCSKQNCTRVVHDNDCEILVGWYHLVYHPSWYHNIMIMMITYIALPFVIKNSPRGALQSMLKDKTQTGSYIERETSTKQLLNFKMC